LAGNDYGNLLLRGIAMLAAQRDADAHAAVSAALVETADHAPRRPRRGKEGGAMTMPCPTCGGSDCICTFASKLSELRAKLDLAEKRLGASLRVIRTIVDEGEERGHAWIRVHGRAFLASLLPEAKP
jgi:hypothetical protein